MCATTIICVNIYICTKIVLQLSTRTIALGVRSRRRWNAKVANKKVNSARSSRDVCAAINDKQMYIHVGMHIHMHVCSSKFLFEVALLRVNIPPRFRAKSPVSAIIQMTL